MGLSPGIPPIMSSRHVDATTAAASVAVIPAQGTGTSLNIYSIFAYAGTSTANQTAQFGQTSTGDKVGLRDLASKGDTIDISFSKGWRLETNTALFISMATSGSVNCTVNYEVENGK